MNCTNAYPLSFGFNKKWKVEGVGPKDPVKIALPHSLLQSTVRGRMQVLLFGSKLPSNSFQYTYIHIYVHVEQFGLLIGVGIHPSQHARPCILSYLVFSLDQWGNYDAYDISVCSCVPPTLRRRAYMYVRKRVLVHTYIHTILRTYICTCYIQSDVGQWYHA